MGQRERWGLGARFTRAGAALLAMTVLCGAPPAALAQYDVVPPPAYPPTSPMPMDAPPPRPNPREVGSATSDAQMDADLQTSGLAWFAVGCLLSVGGVLVGYLVTPEPDASRLLGKSPTYLAAYTDAYRREGKSYQGLHAIYGCVTAAVVDVAVYLLIIALTAAIPLAQGA